MKFLSASQEDFQFLKDFVIPFEYYCTSLCANIRKKKKNIFFITKNQIEKINKINDIFGVIYFDKVFLHCIPCFCDKNFIQSDEFLTVKEDFQKSLINFIQNNKISCLNGTSTTNQIILEALQSIDINPFQTNYYKLMTLKTNPNVPPEKLSVDDMIIRFSNVETDVEPLLELQKMYLAKEVAPAGKQISDLETTARLKAILKDQLCFGLMFDEQIVSKANTNAIGYNWVQLGGVYTHPLYRKNYYAWHLVYTICNRIIKSGRNISLYVKEKNHPARELYSRIGFELLEDYQISYF